MNLTRRPIRRWLLFTGMAILTGCNVAVSLLAEELEPSSEKRLSALIIDGQNNHTDWPQTTAMMRAYMEQTGRFQVDVVRTKFTWNGGKLLEEFPLNDGKSYEDLKNPKTDADFAPRFKDYDVVISNFGFNAAPWPEATRADFEEFVRAGGGFVVVHAANNSFGDWQAFNEMIGLGGWGGRNHESGPYVYVNEKEEIVRDDSRGSSGGHGPQHEYQIVIRQSDHPITRGVPKVWMHTMDELYHKLRGPAVQMNILATAFSAEKFQGTGRHEPIMMTIEYGDGRIYHTPMGHSADSMECVGFVTTFLRGVEWAATGKVTLQELPGDFPTATESNRRKFGVLPP